MGVGGNKMRKMKLTKVICSVLTIASLLSLNPIEASAEWKQDYAGKWYTEGSSFAIGWKNIDGKWYYFNEEGYMVKDRDVDGWYIDSNGIATECIKADGFEIDKSTGTLGKCIKREAFSSPSNLSYVPLVIPKQIEGIEINSIGSRAFDDCMNLESIALPESVKRIGDCAFDNCRALKSMRISDNVTNIGYGAFSGCVSMESITLPKGLTTIEDWLFRCCESLKSITIPDSVTSIGDSAFDNCYSLKSIVISDNVTSIGNCAFWGCNEAIFYVKSEKTKQLILNSNSNIDSNKIIVKS